MSGISGGSRLLTAAGALCGVAGVALSAAASHQGGGNLAIAANFLLLHAPALLAIGLAERAGRALLGAAWLLFAGVLVFAGDLVMRQTVGIRLFPYAAPLGGMGMIAGWLAIAVTALLARRGD